MSYRNWTNEEKARYILTKLQHLDIPPGLLSQIQGWLLSDDNEYAKDRRLNDLFDKIYSEKIGVRGERAYRMLEDFKRITGTAGVTAPRRIPLRKRAAFRVAAVLIPVMVLVGTLFVMFNDRPTVEQLAEMVTLTVDGQQPEKITLPDGTQVWVNKGSVLAYAADFAKNRAVELSGEAYFDVVRDERNPFTVQSGKVAVRVLGTEFNFRAYTDEGNTTVSLVGGKVEVLEDRNVITTLDPLQQLTYDNETGESDISEFDPELIRRWMRRSVALNGVPLGQALDAVGEFYGVGIKCELDTTGKVVTTIIDEAFTLEETLEMIGFMIGGLSFETDGNTVTIM